MPDELNTSSHRYYQRQNNYLLTRDSFSRDVISDAATLSFDTATAARLFSVPGSRGFFYDFSDYSTQFTDTAGTTAITGVGQSLGLVLDKSAGLALGPELVTNGDFSNGLVGWYTTGTASASVVNGEAQVTNVSNLADRLEQIVVGSASEKTYRISADVRTSSGSARVQVLQNGASFLNLGFVDFSNTTTQRISFIATTTGGVGMLVRVTPRAGSAAQIVYVDNISIRELPGNHATQATAGSRALTQVRPMFTQRNRAVGSELVENATYWPASVVNNGLTATKVASGIDTDGLPYVDVRYTGTATDTFHGAAYADQFSRTPAIVGQSWTTSFTARVLSGSLTNVNGLDARTVEETSPITFVGQAIGNQVTASVDTRSVSTRVIASGNQVRLAVVLNVINGATIDITYRIKGLQLELGSARTTYQPAVSGERRNLVLGSGDPGNVTYWPISTSLNGISVTKIGFGLGADGLPYADYQVSGTAALASYIPILANAAVTNASGVGATYTFSGVAQIISGTIPPVGNRPRFEVIELASNQSFLIGTAGTGVTGTEQLFSVTRTTTDATIAFVRGGLVVETLAGSTVNYVFRAKALQFEQASTYSRYQRTITANEWYEPGFQSYRGIRFDGTDDFLQTAAIDFSNSDKMTVVAGVRKLSDAATGILAELSTNLNTNNGAFFMAAPITNGGDNYAFASKGTAQTSQSASGFAAPSTAVVTGLGDISGGSVSVKVNAGSRITLSASQGTGNYGNHPVFIGRRGGTTLPFNGVLTFLCVINRTLTADDLALLETIANSRTGAY